MYQKRILHSTGGVVTFKNAKKVHEIAKNIPLEHLLLENRRTNIKHPNRSEASETNLLMLNFAAEKIAEIRGVSLEKSPSTTKTQMKFSDFKNKQSIH